MLELRDPEKFDLMDFVAGDLDGDGKEELIVRYAPGGLTNRPLFDIIRLTGK